MLELSGLTKHFGGVKAVENLDMSVSEGEIFGLIGPNGSGKSTTINLICGVYPETSGTVTFCGLTMNGMPPHQRLRAGVARTFQNIRLFPNLSVWQNLLVAQNSPDDVVTQRFLPRWFGTTHQTRENIAELLDLAGLSEKSDELASNLAFGEQRRLEFARAMSTRPKLLLLDEPAAGMNQQEIEDLSITNLQGARLWSDHCPGRACYGTRYGCHRKDRRAELRLQDCSRYTARSAAKSICPGSLFRDN